MEGVRVAAANRRVAALPARCVTLHGLCATILMMPDHIFTVWHCDYQSFSTDEVWRIYYCFRQAPRACDRQYRDVEGSHWASWKQALQCGVKIWDEDLCRVKTSQVKIWRKWLLKCFMHQRKLRPQFTLNVYSQERNIQSGKTQEEARLVENYMCPGLCQNNDMYNVHCRSNPSSSRVILQRKYIDSNVVIIYCCFQGGHIILVVVWKHLDFSVKLISTMWPGPDSVHLNISTCVISIIFSAHLLGDFKWHQRRRHNPRWFFAFLKNAGFREQSRIMEVLYSMANKGGCRKPFYGIRP